MARTRKTTAAAAACAALLCVAGGCTLGTTSPTSTMDLTVSAVTDAPMTVYFDARQRGQSGFAGRDVPPTPVELSPQHPSAVVAVPYDPGYWLRVRVAGPAQRPAGVTVGCELRGRDGRLLAADATDPLGLPTQDASCAGAE